MLSLAAVTILTGLAGSELGASTLLLAVAQEQRLRERQVLDPETGEWVDEPTSAPALGGGVLGEARRLLAEGEPRQAGKVLDAWLKQNVDDENYVEALFLRGEAYFDDKDYWKANERYDRVVDSAAGDLFIKALRRQLDVARAFLAGEKRKVWGGVLRLPAYDDGLKILDRIWERAPGTRLAEQALKLKADYYFAKGDMDLAQDEYANLAKEYPSGRYVQLAMLRSAEAAAAAFPGVLFDDSSLLDAEERYRQVQRTFPRYAEREGVADRLDGIKLERSEKDLAVGRWYEKVGRQGAAEFYYRQILRDWPRTLAATEARQRLRAMGVEAPTEDAAP
jgi:outer membrane protein assembly factor BamD (BamD/ComL family)